MTNQPVPESVTTKQWRERAATIPLPTKAYVDGAWTAAQNRDTFDVVNPATGKLLASVAACSDEDVDAVVIAARAALPAWSTLPASPTRRTAVPLGRADRTTPRGSGVAGDAGDG
jgi:hypothetical protein